MSVLVVHTEASVQLKATFPLWVAPKAIKHKANAPSFASAQGTLIIQRTIGTKHDQALRDRDFMYLILPLCNGGELLDMVSRRRTLGGGGMRAMGDDEARTYFRAILEGVEVLHDLQICHR